MRYFLAACALAAFIHGVFAHELTMKAGQDAFIFDNFYGRAVNVYEVLPNEPYSDRMESIMHNWFAVEDILGAIPDADSGAKIKLPLAMGASDDIGANAFAAIYNGKRYIVIGGPIHSNYAMMTLVMGHELGHHICGHTAGAMQQDPWSKELEADTFAGLVVRRMEQHGGGYGLNLKDALTYASQILSPVGSSSHPPLDQRLQAIIHGYNNGSPCVGRPVGPIASNEIGGALQTAGSLWSHNGSILRLLADGADRQFQYEVPHAGLSEVGVAKGTLLFRGRKRGNNYNGKAFIFSKNCGSKSYDVAGPVSNDQRQVTLFGRAPIMDQSCNVKTYREDKLIFTFNGD